MSAEVLREAARLMRELAEAATRGPWMQNGFEYDDETDSFTYDVAPVSDPVTSLMYANDKGNAEHIASWHPSVALAVADWLDAQAERVEIGFSGKVYTQALAVARAYLGDAS